MVEHTIRSTSPKERIIAAARERFLREGFSKVSIDELAADLAISKKTFYKFFENKDDLLGQIVERILRDMNAGFTAIITSDASFVQKLDQTMAFVGRQVGRLARPFLQDLQRYAPHYWQRVQHFRRQRMAVNIGALFDQGITGGYIREDINPRVLLMAFVGTVESVINPAVLSQESFSSDQAMRSILRIFFHGLLTEDASRELISLQQNQTSQSI